MYRRLHVHVDLARVHVGLRVARRTCIYKLHNFKLALLYTSIYYIYDKCQTYLGTQNDRRLLLYQGANTLAPCPVGAIVINNARSEGNKKSFLNVGIYEAAALQLATHCARPARRVLRKVMDAVSVHPSTSCSSIKTWHRPRRVRAALANAVRIPVLSSG